MVAVDPRHAMRLLVGHGWQSLVVLGGCSWQRQGARRCMPMGHVGRRPIRVIWFAVVPQVGRATLATIIASQAIITGAFSLTRQAMQLGMSPGLHIRQTSDEEHGQIYVPAVNWAMMACTLALTYASDSADRLAGAYGAALSTTMLLTTALLYDVMCGGDQQRWRPGFMEVPGVGTALHAALAQGCLLDMADTAFFSAHDEVVRSETQPRQGGGDPAGVRIHVSEHAAGAGSACIALRTLPGGFPPGRATGRPSGHGGAEVVVFAHAVGILPPGRCPLVTGEGRDGLGRAAAKGSGSRGDGGLDAGEPFVRNRGGGAHAARRRELAGADGVAQDPNRHVQAMGGGVEAEVAAVGHGGDPLFCRVYHHHAVVMARGASTVGRRVGVHQGRKSDGWQFDRLVRDRVLGTMKGG